MAELAREYEVGEATIWRVLNPFGRWRKRVKRR
jgi:hypothetical protein